MRHVKQRRTIDCGVAALASATDATYESALKLLEVMPASVGDMLYGLDVLTNRRWQIQCLPDAIPLQHYQPEQNGIYIGVIHAPNHIDEGPRYTHFVCFAREHSDLLVSDPLHETGPIALEHYRRGRTWLLSDLLWCAGSLIDRTPVKPVLETHQRYQEAKFPSKKESSLLENGQVFGQIASIGLTYVVIEDLKNKAAATVFLVPVTNDNESNCAVKVLRTYSDGFIAMKVALAFAKEDNANGWRAKREIDAQPTDELPPGRG
jgi:hypothetical protein